MTQHTPGPWRVSDADDSIIVAGGNGLYIAMAASRGMGDAVKANAQLIAAAPELLAALKAIIDSGSYVQWPEGVQAAAAIAKAEGRAQ